MPVAENTAIRRLAKVAKELKVVLPLSVFERAQNAYFNTLVMVDADGETLGIYRKSHIPESPGYHEKFYFSPATPGSRSGRRATARWASPCAGTSGSRSPRAPWRSWARKSCSTRLRSAPSPQDPTLDSRYHWQRTMQGHAAANVMPLIASNRIGTEKGEKLDITFYGHSFIADHTGAVIAQADDTASRS